MALNIVWTKRANNKFDTIILYLEQEWGMKATSVFVKKVYNFLDVLIEFPEIGTLEHKEKNIRGYTITKQVNIYYKIKENNIIILDFYDNRRHTKRKRY